MAGDWIKMRGNLWDDPRVGRLADATDSTEATIVGGLYWLWATADQHTQDGILPGLSLRRIDSKTGIPGFGAALVAIGWIAEEGDGIRIQRFEEHNGASAKKRAVTAKRVSTHRGGNADVTPTALPNDDEGVTGALAREREEIEEEKSRGRGHSDADASGGKPPQVRPSLTVQDQVFAVGVTLLTAADVSDKNARSFLAAQLKAHHDEPQRVLDVLQRCATERVVQPVPWIVAALGKPGAKPAHNRQEALEQRNRQVAADWAAEGVPDATH